MNIDWNMVLAIFSAISLVTSAISGFYTWSTARDKVSSDNFTELKEEIQKKHQQMTERLHKAELDAMELKGRVNALPTEERMDGLSRAVGKLEVSVGSLATEMHNQGEQLKGVRNSAESINNYLREQGKKR